MDKKKIAGAYDKIAGWSDEEIEQLQLEFLHKMFECNDIDGVDTTVCYAKYLSKIQLNPDNYPVFIKLLQIENHWVVDALVGEKPPIDFLKNVQPNTFLLSECFKMFKKWRPRTINSSSLLVLFGLLKTTYANPHAGYQVYPLTVSDVNHFGKHLDKSRDQSDPVNGAILHVLDSFASLIDAGGLPPTDKNAHDVAIQANTIRGKFLDKNKQLNEAIPDEILKGEPEKIKEISPSFTPKVVKDKV